MRRTFAFGIPLLTALFGAALATGQPVPVTSAPGDAASDAGRCDPLPVSRTLAEDVPACAPPREETPRGREARDPCDDALRAVQFEDVSGAERAWRACRARVTGSATVLDDDALRTLEDVTEALHGLRRSDGAFCVAPGAPFDLSPIVGSVRDTRGCFIALDRLLRSEDAVLRFLLQDAYASGRLARRARVDVLAARSNLRRAPPGSAAEQEQVAIARLLGRHFMRTCRCFPGAQPDAMTSVRAMRLPRTVEAVLIHGIAERGEAEAP